MSKVKLEQILEGLDVEVKHGKGGTYLIKGKDSNKSKALVRLIRRCWTVIRSGQELRIAPPDWKPKYTIMPDPMYLQKFSVGTISDHLKKK